MARRSIGTGAGFLSAYARRLGCCDAARLSCLTIDDVEVDMAKRLTAYVCSECGAEYSKWQGQCTECGVWNTLSEITLESATPTKASPASRRSGWAGKVDAPKIMAL